MIKTELDAHTRPDGWKAPIRKSDNHLLQNILESIMNRWNNEWSNEYFFATQTLFFIWKKKKSNEKGLPISPIADEFDRFKIGFVGRSIAR